MKALQEARGPIGLSIERDLYFEPESLHELMEKHRRQRLELVAILTRSNFQAFMLKLLDLGTVLLH